MLGVDDGSLRDVYGYDEAVTLARDGDDGEEGDRHAGDFDVVMTVEPSIVRETR